MRRREQVAQLSRHRVEPQYDFHPGLVAEGMTGAWAVAELISVTHVAVAPIAAVISSENTPPVGQIHLGQSGSVGTQSGEHICLQTRMEHVTPDGGMVWEGCGAWERGSEVYRRVWRAVGEAGSGRGEEQRYTR